MAALLDKRDQKEERTKYRTCFFSEEGMGGV